MGSKRLTDERTERVEIIVDPVEDALDLDLLGKPGVDRGLTIAEIGTGKNRGRKLLPEIATLRGAFQAERDQVVVKAVIIRELVALGGMGKLVKEVWESGDEHLIPPSLIGPAPTDPVRITVANDHLGATQGEGLRTPGEKLGLVITFPCVFHLAPG